MKQRIDIHFWLMILVIMSQIAAGLLVEKLWSLGIGGPVTIIGTIMIIALCVIKVLAYFDLPARWREQRLQGKAERRAAEMEDPAPEPTNETTKPLPKPEASPATEEPETPANP